MFKAFNMNVSICMRLKINAYQLLYFTGKKNNSSFYLYQIKAGSDK